MTYEELKQHAFDLTSYMETSTAPPGCYGITAGNFDGQGMSFGAIQWNLGAETLQPIFLGMINNHESVAKAAFNYSSDPSYYNTFKTVMTTYSKVNQVAWADSITNPSNPHALISPWNDYFYAMGITSECIALENTAAQWYFDQALAWFDEYKVLSPAPNMFSRRAYALFFDIAVQNGWMPDSVKTQIVSDFAAISTTGKTADQIEIEKMVIIANRRADYVDPTYREIVRQRKLAIANGTGTVYGSLYVDCAVYSITMDAAFASTTTYFQFYNSAERPLQINGIDISHYQLDYTHNFVSAYAAGARFVTFKAGGMTATNYVARYFKCTANGSYTNVSTIFTEFEAYAYVSDVLTNVALGKTVTGSRTPPDYGSPTASYSNVTDGSKSTWVLPGSNTQWIQIDLGTTYTIYGVALWHYAGRKFKNCKIEYSTDGSTWTTLHDTDLSGEYNESDPQGHFTGLYVLKGTTPPYYAKDTTFSAANIASARAAGMVVGAYWFKNPTYCYSGTFLNSAGNASSEASLFWQYITSAFGTTDWPDTLVWLDWENPDYPFGIYPSVNNDDSYTFIKTFCDTIRYLSNGRACGVYTAWYTVSGQATATSDILVHSVNGGLGTAAFGAIPLYYAQIVDYGSSYPGGVGWSQGTFGGWSAWSLWQFSFVNTSAARFGFAPGALDLDICEGSLVNIMQPTHVSGLVAAGAATTIALTWTTGESDVWGYMYSGSGITTATVSTGIGSATITAVSPNTSYAITMYSYDAYEISPATSVTVNTTAVMGGTHTLLCFRL